MYVCVCVCAHVCVLRVCVCVRLIIFLLTNKGVLNFKPHFFAPILVPEGRANTIALSSHDINRVYLAMGGLRVY